MLILFAFLDHNPYPQTPGNMSLIHIMNVFFLMRYAEPYRISGHSFSPYRIVITIITNHHIIITINITSIIFKLLLFIHSVQALDKIIYICHLIPRNTWKNVDFVNAAIVSDFFT